MESTPDNVLLYEDEFSLFNTATVGYQWSKKGEQPQVACKQKARERETAFGSLNYGTGQITVSFAKKRGRFDILEAPKKSA